MAMPAIEIDAQDTGQDEQPGGKPDIGHRIDLHAGADQREYQQIPVEWINVGPWQPRRKFDREQLDELADSIRQKGIVQPILLRPKPNQPDRFQLVAGERRWRAAQYRLVLIAVLLSLVLPLSFLRRPCVEPPGLSEDLAKR